MANTQQEKKGLFPSWLIEIMLGLLIVFSAWVFRSHVETKVWQAQYEARSEAYYDIAKENQIRIDKLRLDSAKHHRDNERK